MMKVDIIRSARRTLAVQWKDGKLLIRAPYAATDRDIEVFLEKHRAQIERYVEKVRRKEEAVKDVPRLKPEEVRSLARKAAEVIPRRVAYYAPIVGVSYGRITIRSQRSRWGSCSSNGNLNFNCLLMLVPPGVLDSVVVHELCHRKEMNHSPRFYAEVLRVLPDYGARDRWLMENGAKILAMLPEK